MEGFITLDRRLLKWQWIDTPEMVSLWINLLLRANHEDRMWHGIEVKRGQLVTSISKLSAQSGLSPKQIRTCMERLTESGCIGKQTTNKYTVITITKYDSYQLNADNENNPEGKQRANEGQAKGKQRATNNNENNINLLLPRSASACTCEGSWDISDIVAKGRVPELGDIWIEEIQQLIYRQLKTMITREMIEEHYKDFQAQEISEISSTTYKEWREHFGAYVRKREQLKLNDNGNTKRKSRQVESSISPEKDYDSDF